MAERLLPLAPERPLDDDDAGAAADDDDDDDDESEAQDFCSQPQHIHTHRFNAVSIMLMITCSLRPVMCIMIIMLCTIIFIIIIIIINITS